MKRIAFFVPHIGCPRQCSFCNQHHISGRPTQVGARQLVRVLERAAETIGSNAETTEIAFFGGSFTAIDRGLMIELLEIAKAYTEKYGFYGIRFSTRPDCVSDEVLDVLSTYPVRRIELGAQSMVNSVLDYNKRGHSAEDTLNASLRILNSGYKLTLQMMIGMAGSCKVKELYTAETLTTIGADEVRVYPTLVLKHTALEALYHSGDYQPLSLPKAVEQSAELLELFEKRDIKVIRLGLQQEEGLSNFVVAGPYHPALRELAEGYNLKKRIMRLCDNIKTKEATVAISHREISKLTGHGGWALKSLADSGYNIRVKTDRKLTLGQLELL